jgi:hypothetical protein
MHGGQDRFQRPVSLRWLRHPRPQNRPASGVRSGRAGHTNRTDRPESRVKADMGPVRSLGPGANFITS